MAKIAETPLMTQYIEMKKKHPDAVLLFRVGDFYETFSEDAITASEILGITLTRRANGKAAYVELAGFPHHALDSYLPKLVRAGKRVAICEQLEDPKLTKKLVKRGITELVTPGVNLNDNTLRPRENNFLAGIHVSKSSVGVAFLDLSTGEFLCAQGDKDYVDKLIANIAPKELLRMHGTRQFCEENISHKCSVFELEDWVYTSDAANERLVKHFGTASLKGFGVDGMHEAVVAAGSLLYYLDLTQHTNISHITSLARIDGDRYVRLDKFTIRNLELLNPLAEEGLSLLKVIDKTVTPMGGRKLRSWVSFPLLDIEEITRRQDAVEYFFRDVACRDRCEEALRRVGDLERLMAKLASNRIGPRDFVSLRDSLRAADTLRNVLSESGSEVFVGMSREMSDTSQLYETIARVIVDDAPNQLGRGNAIAAGVDAELDELRGLHANSRRALEEIRDRESELTGIPSLKIAFNNVFGYYIEVRNTHKDKVPETWIRKQTLVSAERYITPELKEYEEKIVGAEEKISAIENRLFAELVQGALTFIPRIQRNAIATATVDCLLSMARTAEEYRYVRPVVDDSLKISITEGRHPVIERRLPPGEPYISNSVELDSDGHQILMITGPNMSGKSALLRQTALIVLLAQIGSFVPAEAAHIGLVDKIFTRVGASDNISSGESTFMVEMNEAAAILNNMSNRSLVLFDELGRGTSTYDGISIAWAIVEHIHENGHFRPKTLFATHYHELNEMEKTFKRIVNYNVSVKEIKGKVVFMRKLERGGSAHSFGIHVAKLAGMPPSIVKRADQVLSRLEEGSKNDNDSQDGKIKGKGDMKDIGKARDGYQLSFFQLDDPLLSQIRDRLLGINIDNLTPLQALTTLHDLKSLLTGKK
ncbi:DNA mismatch repair protein MutS [Barnesiella sp. CU968]|jgi:DNA mismatch repair protein MutS|uniref:DNA mismatch repair protein MutS n=1 Tax=Barnesiella sp. CU968 TaxID=2780099 RepID=UPI00195B2ABA|nr:DNA mismatch repair protein MutS [Barnesiella sp. CU968]MBJ2196802.1 DNA mismatch repair protein MutS [Muribaculaceae bacterium]MCI9029312.1 DNA mismatch repair protein MutS [Muribaculaceae bacterium]